MATSVEISENFKKQAYKSIFSIVLFVIVYVLLLFVSIALFIASFYCAKFIISSKPSIFTLMLAIGLVAVGFFIVFFMVKFIFKKNETDFSGYTEIDVNEEPELKKMIEELVNEIGTDFPKRVYLSHEVNASVFYNSSFWSMFLPVKKNLHIGLGLVNSTTVSEFKGILAHEFGHFSQKSMKVGSFVYNVNKIIFNILYDNDGYNKAVSTWSSVSGYFVVFTSVAIWLNKGTQAILRQMYKIVNVNYLGLSREMEFHADAIGANIVGSEAMISSILRIDLAAQSYDKVLNYYEKKIKDAVTTENLFPQHSFAMNYVALNSNLEIENNFPKVTLEHAERFNKSKLTIENQWSSHPSDTDRVNAFLALGIPARNINTLPANSLFKDINTTQSQISKKLFSNIQYESIPVSENLDTFMEEISKEYEENKFPKIFNNYYDNHNVEPFDLDKAIENKAPILSPDSFFTNKKTELIYLRNSMQNDSETLKSIAENNHDLKTFDYDGKKYKTKNALEINALVEKEIEANKLIIQSNDTEAFRYFYFEASKTADTEELLRYYKEYFEIDRLYDEMVKSYSQMFTEFEFAYEVLNEDVIRSKMNSFYLVESTFKKDLKTMLENDFFREAIEDAVLNELDSYLKNPMTYFESGLYIEKNIETKNKILYSYLDVLQRSYFLKKKRLLNFKSKFLDNQII